MDKKRVKRAIGKAREELALEKKGDGYLADKSRYTKSDNYSQFYRDLTTAASRMRQGLGDSYNYLEKAYQDISGLNIGPKENARKGIVSKEDIAHRYLSLSKVADLYEKKARAKGDITHADEFRNLAGNARAASTRIKSLKGDKYHVYEPLVKRQVA